MHPLALKSGVHTKMYNTIFYDSDANQVKQKPVFHSGTVVSYIVNIHSWNLNLW